MPRAVSRCCSGLTFDIAPRCRLCGTRGGEDVLLLVLGARRCFVLVLAAARARHPTRLNVATRARASLCFLSLPFSCSTLEMAPCFHSSARRSARRLVATRAWRATLLRAVSRYCPCSTLDIATRCRLCQTRGGGDVFLLVLGARRCLMLALAAARARNSMLLLPIGLDALIALRSHSTSYSEPLLSCRSLRAFRALLVFDLHVL